MIYSALWIFAVQQSDAMLHVYILFLNIFFHYGLSQEIIHSPLWYTVGTCCLFILSVIVCIYQPQIPSLSPFFPLGNNILISMSMSLFLFCRQVHLCHILNSTSKWYHIVSIFVFFFLTIHLVWWSLVASMLLQMALFCSFYGYYSIVYVCISSLSIHLSMDI